MDMLALVILIVLILAIAGVVAYVARDYYSYKDEQTAKINDDLGNVNASLNTEKEERLANVASVVSQVNQVNTDIYNTYSSNLYTQSNQFSKINSDIQAIEADSQLLIGNINKYLQFGGGNVGTGSSNVGMMNLLDIPGSATPDLNLMTRVNAVSGLTIKNVSSANPVNICSAADPNRCVRFSDNDGNLFLTSMVPSKTIVMGAASEFRGNINLTAAANTSSYTRYGGISASGNSMLIDSPGNIALQPTQSVGIGTTNPSAAIEIVSTSATKDLLRATSPNGSVVIKADGTIVVGTGAQAVQIQPNNVAITKVTPPPA